MIFIMIFDTESECNKFVRVFEKYQGCVMYTASLFLNDHYEREDVCQEVFLILAKHLNQIEEDNYKRTQNYIITITRNYCKEYLRKKKRLKEDIEDYTDSKVFESPQDIIIEVEEYQKLKERIRGLKDTYRIVMELKYINHFTEEEMQRH